VRCRRCASAVTRRSCWTFCWPGGAGQRIDIEPRARQALLDLTGRATCGRCAMCCARWRRCAMKGRSLGRIAGDVRTSRGGGLAREAAPRDEARRCPRSRASPLTQPAVPQIVGESAGTEVLLDAAQALKEVLEAKHWHSPMSPSTWASAATPCIENCANTASPGPAERNSGCDFPRPGLPCVDVLRGRLCTFIFSVSAALSWARWRCWPRNLAIASPAPTPTSIRP
jgi:hypothetical protein